MCVLHNLTAALQARSVCPARRARLGPVDEILRESAVGPGVKDVQEKNLGWPCWLFLHEGEKS